MLTGGYITFFLILIFLLFISFGRQCEKELSDSELLSCSDAGDVDHPDKAPRYCHRDIF